MDTTFRDWEKEPGLAKGSKLATQERAEPGSAVSPNSTEKNVSIKNITHSVNSDMRIGGNWE